MGWSLRKSKSFGAFRFSLSNSGLGVSVGVKGARVSFTQRGTYVNLGANGIHYRQRINTGNVSRDIPVPSQPSPGSSVVNPHTITTGNVDHVTDVDSKAFINELESKANKKDLFKWLGLWPSIILFMYAISFADDVVREDVSEKDVFVIAKRSVYVRATPTKEGESVAMAKQGNEYDVEKADSLGWVYINLASLGKYGFVRADMGEIKRIEDRRVRYTRAEEYPALMFAYTFLAGVLIVWCVYLKQLDKKRKTLAIYYTLDKDMQKLYNQFLGYFKEFASSKRIWQNLHTTGVSDAKYHGGASTLVSRAGVGGVSYHKLPSPFLKTNVAIPCITLKNIELYFFPERLIVKRGNTFGAVFYKNIDIEKSNVRFIESDFVPSDAQVVDYTWKYLNKSGGPDRRFNDNRQLPICWYSEYAFTSYGGLNEVITTSKAGAMDNFSSFVKAIGEFQGRLTFQ